MSHNDVYSWRVRLSNNSVVFLNALERIEDPGPGSIAFLLTDGSTVEWTTGEWTSATALPPPDPTDPSTSAFREYLLGNAELDDVRNARQWCKKHHLGDDDGDFVEIYLDPQELVKVGAGSNDSPRKPTAPGSALSVFSHDETEA